VITVVLVKEEEVWAYDIGRRPGGEYVVETIPCGAQAHLVSAAIKKLDGHLMTTQKRGCKRRRRR